MTEKPAPKELLLLRLRWVCDVLPPHSAENIHEAIARIVRLESALRDILLLEPVEERSADIAARALGDM